jgi:predicted unusual protein kinase regulating ubiquinone biosynthesis (AarF/ABC1/UbiB family)
MGMGAMVGAIGANVALAGARQVLSRQPPNLADLLTAPANALRVADQLSHMRGAAMKLGQMLSMDSGQILPPEWAAILARLQSDAAPMPRHQLDGQLMRAWGRHWRDQFATFSVDPIAAASIGQVHRGRTKDGSELAIKVQYPGIAASIDSDLDNLVSLLKLSHLVPAGLEIDSLAQEARRQLHEEADYLLEAQQMARYGRLVAGDQSLLVPDVDTSLTRKSVLAMTFVESQPIDFVAQLGADERNRVAERLCRLVLQEIFEFGLIQTDPNFANFRYQPGSGRIVLLDFGATRALSVDLQEKFRALLRVALGGNRQEIRSAMQDIGYFGKHQDKLAQLALDLLQMGMDSLAEAETFDFAAADLPAKARDRALREGFGADLWSIPPVDTLFVHRKIGGMYLLASRLKARVRVRDLLDSFAYDRSPIEPIG